MLHVCQRPTRGSEGVQFAARRAKLSRLHACCAMQSCVRLAFICPEVSCPIGVSGCVKGTPQSVRAGEGPQVPSPWLALSCAFVPVA
eukprot:7253328-Prymnesium_polylepis.1